MHKVVLFKYNQNRPAEQVGFFISEILTKKSAEKIIEQTKNCSRLRGQFFVFILTNQANF
jgi:hypothetical protein